MYVIEMIKQSKWWHMFFPMHAITHRTRTITANKAKMAQKQLEREKWLEVMKRYGKGTLTAKEVVAMVKTGHNPVVFCSTSEQDSLIRHTPATDMELLSIPAPTIPHRVMAIGRLTYNELRNIGRGGFGEVFKGEVGVLQEDSTESVMSLYALKRALPPARFSPNIDNYLNKQTHRLETLQREAEVYFSTASNTRTCRHLALLYDVAQVLNSDGDQEPLLVLQWADGPCSTLGEWLKKRTSIVVTIKKRLSFAVQICAGLRELHHEYKNSPGSPVHSFPAHTNSTAEAAIAVPPVSTPSSAFVHHDLKPDNILLFGGADDDDGPVRLALTDFGMTVRCNSGLIVGGTPTYMAPEQWLNQPAMTPARDIWAAGLVLAKLFEGENTLLALKKYRDCCAVASNIRIIGERAKLVEQLCLLALRVADAMATDATQDCRGGSNTRPTGVPTDGVRVTQHVQRKVAAIMRECFACESNLTGTIRPTSAECEHRFIALWNDVFGRLQPWSKHHEALPEPKESPFEQNFDADERQGSYLRLVESRLLRMMLKRCDALLRTAQKKHADTKVLQYLCDRLEPHKHKLRTNLIKTLESACQCFESALCTAKIPVCVECGRQQVQTRGCKPSATVLIRGEDGNMLYECAGCHTVHFCSAECHTQYLSSDWGKMHYDGGVCRLRSIWRQKGWPVVGMVQTIELMMLRGEVWQSVGGVLGAEQDDVLDQFTKVQAAWEQVYANAHIESWLDKYFVGVAAGIIRDVRVDVVYSPMMQACSRGLSELVGAVLDAPEVVIGPIDRWVNHTEPQYGFTPLFIACLYGHVEVVRCLLDKAQGIIDVNQVSKDDGSTPLLCACEVGHTEIVALLLDKARDTLQVNQATTDVGLTPLSQACQNGHTEIVALLLDKARDTLEVNRAATDDGRTPLLQACQNGHAEVVALLLDKALNTISVNQATTDDNYTPLAMACQNGHAEVVALLLEITRNIIDVNKSTMDYGLTPLFIACQEGHAEVVALLLDKARDTIDVNQATTDDGSTPLFAACLDGHAKVVALLLDKTQDRIKVNQARTDTGATPLIQASENGHAEVVALLLEKAQDTILMASQNGHAEVVAVLLNKARETINVNKGTTDDGCTPLLMACQNGHVEVVALLLDKARDTVDVNRARTDVNATPLMMASQNGHVEVVKLLLDKARDTIDVNRARTDNRSTPLFMACQNGHAKIVKILLDKAQYIIDVNLPTSDGSTPLHIACQEGHAEVVGLILDKVRDSIDIYRVRATDRSTPLSIASQNGHVKIAAMLRDARDKITAYYLRRFFLVRLPVWFGFLVLCKKLFQRRITTPAWIVFTACSWTLHRHTKLFWHHSDELVGLNLLREGWRSVSTILYQLFTNWY